MGEGKSAMSPVLQLIEGGPQANKRRFRSCHRIKHRGKCDFNFCALKLSPWQGGHWDIVIVFYTHLRGMENDGHLLVSRGN